MNTIIMFNKFTDDSVENTNNVMVISTVKTVQGFQALFEEKLFNFVNKIMELNKPMNEALSLLTDADYGEEITKNMTTFGLLNEKVETYKKENFIFEIENQFIDLRKYFWNDQYYHEYQIMYLQDWVDNKKQELSIKPEFGY